MRRTEKEEFSNVGAEQEAADDNKEQSAEVAPAFVQVGPPSAGGPVQRDNCEGRRNNTFIYVRGNDD